jgi:hypothetical protein
MCLAMQDPAATVPLTRALPAVTRVPLTWAVSAAARPPLTRALPAAATVMSIRSCCPPSRAFQVPSLAHLRRVRHGRSAAPYPGLPGQRHPGLRICDVTQLIWVSDDASETCSAARCRYWKSSRPELLSGSTVTGHAIDFGSTRVRGPENLTIDNPAAEHRLRDVRAGGRRLRQAWPESRPGRLFAT